MNLERVNVVESVNLKGKKPIEVRLFREIGQRQYNATARFIGNSTDFFGAWHSLEPKETKRIAIQKLLEHEEIWKFL